MFASGALESLSDKYTFIPTERVLTGLMSAGFVPVEARQARSRKGSPVHARHILRLRRRFETVQLRDSLPEIVFLNSHDGSSAYQLRMGIYRVVCTNGLIVSRGRLPDGACPIAADVVDDVITGALEMAERFDALAGQVERMEQRLLLKDEQLEFAAEALAIRFADICAVGHVAFVAAGRTPDGGCR